MIKRPIKNLLVIVLLLMAAPAWAGIKIVVEGLDGDEKDNVLQRLAISDAAERKDLDEVVVQRLHAQAESDIRTALQPFGYYGPLIKSELSGESPDWTARYTIALGAPTIVTHVELLLTGPGAEFEALKKASENPILREGRVLRHQGYEETKTRLIQIALANGFLDAQYTRSQLLVNPAERTAEALLTLETGPRYFFGPVTIEQEGLKPELVQHYIRIQTDGPYDPRQVLDTQFALTDMDYFQTVEILPRREETVDNHIPITIKTTPRARIRYSIGGGYGTDTGARVTGGIEFRRLNSSGHKLKLDARVSHIKSVYGGEYRIPLGTKSSESVSLNASSTAEKFTDGSTLNYLYGVSLNRTPGKWQRKLYFNYLHEDSTVPDSPSNSDLLLPGVSFNRGETDDPIHTRRGWNFFADVHGAHQDLLSTATFLQIHSQARAAYPLSARLHLLGRAEIGATFADAFSDLPPSQRFFAGGDQSVRGYGYQTLAPRDPVTGKIVGGRYLTVLSAEADYRLIGNWGVATFVDAGGADDNPWPDLYRGVGVGARYIAPIGYLNVDVAHPLDGDTKGVRLHLSLRVGL